MAAKKRKAPVLSPLEALEQLVQICEHVQVFGAFSANVIGVRQAGKFVGAVSAARDTLSCSRRFITAGEMSSVSNRITLSQIDELLEARP